MIRLNEHGLKAARFPKESFSWWDCSIDRESQPPPPFRTIRLFLAPCLFVIKHRHLSGTCLVHFIESEAGCVFNVYERFICKWFFKAIERKAVWWHRRFKDGGQRDTTRTTCTAIILPCLPVWLSTGASNPVRSKGWRGISGISSNSSWGILVTLVNQVSSCLFLGNYFRKSMPNRPTHIWLGAPPEHSGGYFGYNGYYFSKISDLGSKLHPLLLWMHRICGGLLLCFLAQPPAVLL